MPVHKRNSLRTGADQIQDREEFWKWVLEPLVNSLSPKSRVIDLVDQYLFQNVDKVLSEFRRSKKTSDLDSIGLNWLLKKIAKSSEGLPQKTKVNIFTAERSTKKGDAISKEEITFLIEEISPAWDIRLVDFYIYVVPQNLLTGEVQQQIHNRRIVLNQRYYVGLDRGFDDLSVYWRSRSLGLVEDIDRSWFYLPNLMSESGRHNTKLLRLTIPDDYVLELI